MGFGARSPLPRIACAFSGSAFDPCCPSIARVPLFDLLNPLQIATRTAYRASQALLPLRNANRIASRPERTPPNGWCNHFMHEMSMAAKRDHVGFLLDAVVPREIGNASDRRDLVPEPAGAAIRTAAQK